MSWIYDYVFHWSQWILVCKSIHIFSIYGMYRYQIEHIIDSHKKYVGSCESFVNTYLIVGEKMRIPKFILRNY